MRKLIVQTTREGKMIITEVEIELVKAVEDPSVMWLPKGEYRARVMKPESLHEKQEDGSLQAPIWYSHIFYETSEEVWEYIEKSIREGFERDLRHHKITAYTEEEVQQKLSEIEEVVLS
jgi:hypothetical protein